MPTHETHAVTGAFGYSGRYIAERLLAAGHRVRTLTNSPARRPLRGGPVEAFPLCFDDRPSLTESLRGVQVLYNTYWVRFNHRRFTHAQAVVNTQTLFAAAKAAGVERVVHVSITNPAEDSPLEYFSGKAALERALQESGLSHAILRPTVLFGREDVLLNNLAWMLRRFPCFGVFGDGSYRLQPVYVDDLARLAVEAGQSREDYVLNAIGPETFTFRELVETLGRLLGCPRPGIPAPPALGYWVGWLVGKIKGDVLITREEIVGLRAGLLCVSTPPTGTTRLTQWVRAHADTLGARYASELARRRGQWQPR